MAFFVYNRHQAQQLYAVKLPAWSANQDNLFSDNERQQMLPEAMRAQGKLCMLLSAPIIFVRGSEDKQIFFNHIDRLAKEDPRTSAFPKLPFSRESLIDEFGRKELLAKGWKEVSVGEYAVRMFVAGQEKIQFYQGLYDRAYSRSADQTWQEITATLAAEYAAGLKLLTNLIDNTVPKLSGIKYLMEKFHHGLLQADQLTTFAVGHAQLLDSFIDSIRTEGI